MRYQVLFKNDGGHLFATEYLAADGDAQAIERARRIFRSGIGHGYEIWRNDSHVHTEPAVGMKPDATPGQKSPAQTGALVDSHDADRYDVRAEECLRLAAQTQDLVLREQLLSLHKGCIEFARRLRERAGAPAGPGYKLCLRDGEGRVVARQDMTVNGDGEAIAVAAALRDATSDIAAQFEVWNGENRLRHDGLDKLLAISAELNKRHQQIVLDLEIALRDSRWRIAESKRLLENIDDLSGTLREKKGQDT